MPAGGLLSENEAKTDRATPRCAEPPEPADTVPAGACACKKDSAATGLCGQLTSLRTSTAVVSAPKDWPLVIGAEDR